MLFDPKWEAKTRPDVFSLPSFIGWLEKQNPRKRYDFMDCEGACLLGQYMASVGESWSPARYSEIAESICSGYRGFTFYIGVESPRTFGGALRRAREVLHFASKG